MDVRCVRWEYFFGMLEKAEGSACYATNLLKALDQHPRGTEFSLTQTDWLLTLI